MESLLNIVAIMRLKADFGKGNRAEMSVFSCIITIMLKVFFIRGTVKRIEDILFKITRLFTVKLHQKKELYN